MAGGNVCAALLVAVLSLAALAAASGIPEIEFEETAKDTGTFMSFPVFKDAKLTASVRSLKYRARLLLNSSGLPLNSLCNLNTIVKTSSKDVVFNNFPLSDLLAPPSPYLKLRVRVGRRELLMAPVAPPSNTLMGGYTFTGKPKAPVLALSLSLRRRPARNATVSVMFHMFIVCGMV